jgi:hypothetical protein
MIFQYLTKSMLKEELATVAPVLVAFAYGEEDWMAKERKERRKHRRAELDMPIDMQGFDDEGKSFTARTINLSAGGFYCALPFHVPTMTKLRVSLVIPVADGAGKVEKHPITCEGMVVRTVPEKPTKGKKVYEIGCFFTEIDDYDRLVIEQYLAQKSLAGK